MQRDPSDPFGPSPSRRTTGAPTRRTGAPSTRPLPRNLLVSAPPSGPLLGSARHPVRSLLKLLGVMTLVVVVLLAIYLLASAFFPH